MWGDGLKGQQKVWNNKYIWNNKPLKWLWEKLSLVNKDSLLIDSGMAPVSWFLAKDSMLSLEKFVMESGIGPIEQFESYAMQYW